MTPKHLKYRALMFAGVMATLLIPIPLVCIILCGKNNYLKPLKANPEKSIKVILRIFLVTLQWLITFNPIGSFFA